MMGPAYMVGSFFGNKEYGQILGLVNLNFAIGFCSGSAYLEYLLKTLDIMQLG